MTDWYKELQNASEAELFEITKAVIRKVGKEFCIFSKDNKNLGCFSSRKKALKRLREIEFFKREDENN
ncbi:hypothetical protein LCGC14_1045890 [marine sediment metagenome]|uniref:Uncharacterized protein n=1 Tax=marine sediment metagenome TaxID=412755 RepID=A0A0F9MUQ9_9ZZZZ